MQGYCTDSACFGPHSVGAEFSLRPKKLAAVLAILGFLLLISRTCAEEPGTVHLYFFTNQGCAPCRQVEPSIEQLKSEGYPVSTIQLSQQPELAQRFSIDRTPTVVMIANDRMVGRHAGLIDSATLKDWFDAVGFSPNASSGPDKLEGNETRQASTRQAPVNQRFQMANANSGPAIPSQSIQVGENSTRTIPVSSESRLESGNQQSLSTLHKGTARPANQAEYNAMQATVRLKVQDTDGISYATGTVIHCHDGECLVMTCGHVFREAGFKGEISAEFNFAEGAIKTGPGELIAYDSNARDVALVAVNAGSNIVPVKIARQGSRLYEESPIFTIGCDGGANPTIRHSKIKSHAIYDGAPKYDIYGRPAIGRSGGGMFNEEGELLGVCNAAAVKSDEGIYSALESIHWQIADAKLAHLFVPDNARNEALVSVVQPSLGKDDGPRFERPGSNGMRNSPVAWQKNSDPAPSEENEVIIIVRDKRNQKVANTITLDNPTPQLLDYLNRIEETGRETRELDIARLRKGKQEVNQH